MLQSAVAYSSDENSTGAGASIGSQVIEAFKGEIPDALVVFSSSKYNYDELLRAISEKSRARIIVGCSSAGEFTNQTQGTGSVSAVALRSTEMVFGAAVGRGLRDGRNNAASELVSGLRGVSDNSYLYRSALVLTDALAGQVDDFVEQLTILTGGTYRFFGGGAGDDAAFSRTHVFYGTEALLDAAVALEILSNKPVGIGVSHGWMPASVPMRVTESEGMRLVSVNAAPAVEMFEEHAELTGQAFDREDPLPFFLHNVIGIKGDAGHHLRVPLGIGTDGSILCAADVPTGASIQVMSVDPVSSANAATLATQSAISQLEGLPPKVAIFFDCVATRLRMGKDFGLELGALQNQLGSATYVGCNTYGQIARSEGEFSGFHNCTAVVCVLPE